MLCEEKLDFYIADLCDHLIILANLRISATCENPENLKPCHILFWIVQRV